MFYTNKLINLLYKLITIKENIITPYLKEYVVLSLKKSILVNQKEIKNNLILLKTKMRTIQNKCKHS